MKIIKIRNRLMYNGNNPNGIHYYAIFWNKKYKKYNAIQLTHISNKDNVRYRQANNGVIKPIRLKQIDKYADNGITKKKYISDVNGNRLNPNMGLVVVNNVSGSSSKKIKNFATNLYFKGNKIN